MTAKRHTGSSFDDFPEGQGICDETHAVASKRVLARQLAQAMKAGHLTAAAMVERMGTTESEGGRLLDLAETLCSSTRFDAPPTLSAAWCGWS